MICLDIKIKDTRKTNVLSACRKSLFFQKKCLFSIPIPKPLPRGEGLCMLCWLCIVQSLWAYTPGILAGAILLGLPPLVQARMLAVSRTKPLHDAVAQMADDLYGGSAPATPFLNKQEVFR